MKKNKVVKRVKCVSESYVEAKKELIIEGFEKADSIMFTLPNHSIQLINAIKTFIQRKSAVYKAYKEVQGDCDDISYKLKREAKPLLSPYLLEFVYAEGKAGHKKISGILNLLSTNEGKDVICFPSVEGKLIVGEIDGFLEVALKLDAVIFASQYYNFECDIEQLRSLITEYIYNRPKFNCEEYAQKESLYYKTLGSLYAKVMQNRENYERHLQHDELVRIRTLEAEITRK